MEVRQFFCLSYFTMESPILVSWYLYIESGPSLLFFRQVNQWSRKHTDFLHHTSPQVPGGLLNYSRIHNRPVVNMSTFIDHLTRIWYKSGGKCRNTLCCLDQYTCKVLRLWNSQARQTVYLYKYVQRMETMKQSCLWSSLGTHGSLVVIHFQ